MAVQQKDAVPVVDARVAAEKAAQPPAPAKPVYKFAKTLHPQDPVEVAGERIKFAQPVFQDGRVSSWGYFSTSDSKVADALRALPASAHVFEQDQPKGK